MTPPASSPRRRRAPLDLAALLLAPAGVAVVVLAQIMAGLPAGALLQIEAALIVLGGTAGALLLTYSPRVLLRTVREVAATFRVAGHDLEALAATIVALATRVHRRGLLSIDREVDAVAEPFLRDGLACAVDEMPLATLQDLLAGESMARAEEDEAPARLLEAAAGYAPTLGILGAVLGLIHVMRSTGAPSGLGKGIAVAFVATVYGVGLANLVLLPLAGRLRERAALAARRRAMMTTGICAIQQREHPRVIAQRLRSFGVTTGLAVRGPLETGMPTLRPAGAAARAAARGHDHHRTGDAAIAEGERQFA